MKNSFKKWYNYIFALALSVIPVEVGIIPYFAINDAKIWPLNFVYYAILFGGVVLLGIGFVWQDVYRGLTRKKIGDWDNKLDQKYINNAWAIFMPFFLSGCMCIAAGLIMNFLFTIL